MAKAAVLATVLCLSGLSLGHTGNGSLENDMGIGTPDRGRLSQVGTFRYLLAFSKMPVNTYGVQNKLAYLGHDRCVKPIAVCVCAHSKLHQ